MFFYSTSSLTFAFEANQLRMMAGEKDETWFCLKYICNILSIDNSSELLKRLKKSGVDLIEVAFEQSVARLNFIDEPRLSRYKNSLIIKTYKLESIFVQ